MNILYILKHDPWGIGGGCYASKRYLELFCSVFADAHIDCLVCEEYLKNGKVGDFPNVNFVPVKPRTKLSQLLTPITGILHRHQETALSLIKDKKYDYCIFDHNSIAGTLATECKKRGIKTIVLNHNCEYEYYRDNNTGLRKLLILPWVSKREKLSYKTCDFNIFLTKEDERIFTKRYGKSETKRTVGGIFNGPNEKIKPVTDLPQFHTDNIRLVISGTMGNIQNLDGINYFLDDLYPTLPNTISVVLAGKNPPNELIEKVKQYTNVEIIANPIDMDAVVRECDIFVCPARLGGGIKLRVTDGLRNGLPVIAHEVSARGYEEFEEKGYLVPFSDKDTFLSIFIDLKKEIASSGFNKQDIAIIAYENFDFYNTAMRVKNSILR